MNKKGIELSINFLVILILSIVVFGFGIAFLAKITKVATDMELPSEEKFYLEACLNEGKSVCMGTNRREGKVKDVIIMGIGISNTIGEAHFFVYNEFKKAVLDNGNVLDSGTGEKIPQISQGPKDVLIKKNEDEYVVLAYSIPQGTKAGEYVFDVYVCADGAERLPENRENCPSPQGTYGGLHKIYIEVK